jgi:hypothetical protein
MRSRGLVSFLCRKPEAWFMEGLPVQETTTGKLKLRSSAPLTDDQRQAVASILQSKDLWLNKVDRLVAVQPLHFPICCGWYKEQTSLQEVEAKFGRPDRHEAGIIYQATAGTWHVYGSLRLGVSREGRVLLVEVNGPRWLEEQRAVGGGG